MRRRSRWWPTWVLPGLLALACAHSPEPIEISKRAMLDLDREMTAWVEGEADRIAEIRDDVEHAAAVQELGETIARWDQIQASLLVAIRAVEQGQHDRWDHVVYWMQAARQLVETVRR